MENNKIKIGAARYLTYVFVLTIAKKVSASEYYYLMHGEFEKNPPPDNILQNIKNKIDASFEIDPEIDDSKDDLDHDLLINELIEYKRKGVI